MKDLEKLIDFLGSDNVKKIQDGMTEMILANLEDSINKCWVVTPEEIEEMYSEVGEEVAEKMRAKYKKALTCKVEDIIKQLQ